MSSIQEGERGKMSGVSELDSLRVFGISMVGTEAKAQVRVRTPELGRLCTASRRNLSRVRTRPIYCLRAAVVIYSTQEGLPVPVGARIASILYTTVRRLVPTLNPQATEV